MMRQILTSDELRKEFEKNDFVLKTQKQIAKDFFSVGIMFPQQFELESMKMDEIIEQIQHTLNTELGKHGSSRSFAQQNNFGLLPTSLSQGPKPKLTTKPSASTPPQKVIRTDSKAQSITSFLTPSPTAKQGEPSPVQAADISSSSQPRSQPNKRQRSGICSHVYQKAVD